MQGYARAGRQGNLPLDRLSLNDARLMAQADLSPADMHFVYKGIYNSGLESLGFDAQMTKDEARVFGRIKSGGSRMADMRVDRASPFGNLVLQGEGRESETDAGDLEFNHDLAYTPTGEIWFAQTLPLPFTIVALSLDVDFGG